MYSHCSFQKLPRQHPPQGHYQYFEERCSVNILGAFTVNTDVMPGAEQLKEIREVIEHDKVACVFSEPQFNPDIIKAVAKDMNIKTCLLYTSPSPRDKRQSRMPSSA